HATEIYRNDASYLLQYEKFSYLRQASREVQNTWLHVILAGMEEGVFRSDLDARVIYRLMRDALWLSVRWFKPSRDYPLSRLAEECTSLFVDGLTARSPLVTI